jgi:hypothetical protein
MTGAARSLSTRTRKFKRACDWCSPSSESCKALGLSCFICAGTLFVFRFGLFLGLHPMNSSGERRAPVRFDISCITRLTRELMFTGVEQCKPRLGRPKGGRRALRFLWASGRSAFYQPTLATSAGRSS